MKRAIAADGVMTSAGLIGEAVVIEGGRVVEVTTRARIGELPVSDHPGATIVPGMVDSHLHPIGYASLLSGVSLNDADGIDDLVRRIAAASEGGPVIAQRLDDTTLGGLPSRHDLDRAVSDQPVLAYRYCMHVAVANTAALRLAGIGPGTPDPAGGRIDRDSDGNPTGVLRETAIELVTQVVDPLLRPPSDAEVLDALAGLVATGLTGITGIATGTNPLWCGVGNELDTLCRLAGSLPLDIDLLVTAGTPEELRRAAGQVEAAGGRLRFAGWKEWADGSFGAYTAAMWSPFADRDTAGTSRLDPEHGLEMARTAVALGGVPAIHAIGDRAIDETLDLLAGLEDGAGARPRIEHASVPTDTAVGRMAGAGVVASVQPAFLTSERDWVRQRLGPDRPPYRFRSMVAAGVDLLGGSDCPVEPPDPLAGIAAAVSRSDWDDGESVDVATALGWFTSKPAEVAGRPVPLSPGSPADLVVVDGEVASFDATVRAVYQVGSPVALAPIPWPG